MTSFRIQGGVRLEGRLEAAGSKNAALLMTSAAILTDEPIRLRRVPRLCDVQTQTEILRHLGVLARRESDVALLLQTEDERRSQAPYRLMRKMRAGFCVLGALLARRKKAIVPLPGGCCIGPRPVDLHLHGLEALGASFRLARGSVVGEAKRLRGAEIDLAGPFGPTVTGTANVLLAATLAEGVTIIRNAACEPEVVDLGRLLNGMGAEIEGLGTPEIRIEGRERLHGAEYEVMPDRIEAATLLLAGVITQGRVRVLRTEPKHLTCVLSTLADIGAEVHCGADWIEASASRRLTGAEIVAEPFPGMPTDVQAQWTAIFAQADGRSRVCDKVFPQRFAHLPELARLGAHVRQVGDSAEITGVERFRGASVTACDLRASAALVLAGLAAEGRTVVHDVEHLDRGYERLDKKLRRLGAEILRVDQVEAIGSMTTAVP